MNNIAASLLLAFFAAFATPAPAQIAVPPRAALPAPAPALTYADLLDLADHATVVARVQIRSASRLQPGQTAAPIPGHARVFVEARTRALLLGEGLGESVSYIAEVPLDRRGKLPNLRKSEALIFARAVPGRPGQLQLTAPDAQQPWSPMLETRVRSILAELVMPGAPPRVRGVREAMHVRGNLLGAGESQIFMAAEGDEPVSVTVISRAGGERSWGVSLGEVVDAAARPPAIGTLAWYRLACFLPESLPATAILGGDENARLAVAEDYRFVRQQLGACARQRLHATPR